MPPPDVDTNPQFVELQQESQQLVALAGTYTVTDATDYAMAADDLKRIKGALSRLETLRTSITRPMDAAKKAVMDLFRAPEEKLAKAEGAVKRAMLTYSSEQQRIQREAQQKVEEAARKERERLSARAVKAEARGDIGKAAMLEQQAQMVVAPVIPREVPKIAGQSTRDVWRYRIVNAALIPREYLMPDEKKLAGVVRAMKLDTNIPGIEVIRDSTLASSAA